MQATPAFCGRTCLQAMLRSGGFHCQLDVQLIMAAWATCGLWQRRAQTDTSLPWALKEGAKLHMLTQLCGMRNS